MGFNCLQRMKKIVLIISLLVAASQVEAQNEARFGLFTGINNTVLSNSKDEAFGDMLPTFKPSIGVSAGYHFTLFKRLPIGISAQVASTWMGQNYNGEYADSTSYYAYSRLHYIRPGLSLHFGSNPRRLVSFEGTIGANYGFLTKYQERYELIRYDNSRYILNIQDQLVQQKDTYWKSGTLADPLYNKTDMAIFGTMGLNFLFSRKIVFGFFVRMDLGQNDVENKIANKITIDGNPPTTTPFLPYQLDVKYRGPYSATANRASTVNKATGVYLTLKYRLYNKEKIEFWYREHKWAE